MGAKQNKNLSAVLTVFVLYHYFLLVTYKVQQAISLVINCWIFDGAILMNIWFQLPKKFYIWSSALFILILGGDVSIGFYHVACTYFGKWVSPCNCPKFCVFFFQFLLAHSVIVTIAFSMYSLFPLSQSVQESNDQGDFSLGDVLSFLKKFMKGVAVDVRLQLHILYFYIFIF